MKIAVIGATGMVGSAVTDEALRRDHCVTAVARQPLAQPARPGVTAHAVAADDDGAMRALLADADAAVVAIRARANEDSTVVAATATLLDAAAATGTRLLVIGGAGPLRTPGAPLVRLVDNPDFVPVAWRSLALTSSEQLRVCQQHASADWVYLSPSAILEPGTRTGHYRRGTDTALIGTDGRSRITAEDLAVAVIDELELRSPDRHFTVGY